MTVKAVRENILNHFFAVAVMAYPASDHFDGEKFHNPSGSQLKGFLSLLKWWWGEPKSTWPEEVEPPKTPELKPLGDDALEVVFIGHATFLIRTSQFTVLTDPIFSLRASPFSNFGPKRVRPPALSLEQLLPIDYVLLSHNHYDHLDVDSLRFLEKKFGTQVLTPLGNAETLHQIGVKKVLEMDWFQTGTFKHFLVHCVPAEHWSGRGLLDRNKALWSGFILQWGSRKIFFAGDTGYGSHFKDIQTRYGSPDLALLPIGAYEPRWFMKAHHMNPEEAVSAHQDLSALRSIGMHFGTFQLTNEGIDAPAQALTAAKKQRNLNPEAFVVPFFGQSFTLQKGDDAQGL